jgi:hypothetical protein
MWAGVDNIREQENARRRIPHVSSRQGAYKSERTIFFFPTSINYNYSSRWCNKKTPSTEREDGSSDYFVYHLVMI